MSTAYRHRTDPPAMVVAVGGALWWRTLGIAYFGDTGSWYLRSRVRDPLGMCGREELHAQLYAIFVAIGDHPGVLEVRCSYLPAVELVRDWQAGRALPVPGYRGKRLNQLGAIALARRTTLTVSWAGHAGHPLDGGADALARVASRAGMYRLSASEVRQRATDVVQGFVLAVS